VPPYHRHRIAPFRQLVAAFEVVHDLCSVRAAQLHEEVEALVHYVGHEVFHFLIAKFASRVHVLQLFRVAETIVRHFLGQPLSEDRIVL
jgi:hypothetical protein